MTMQKQFAFPLTAMTAAVLAAFNPAYANEEIDQLTKPVSSISVGAGYLTEDAPRFGRHSGLNEQGFHSLLNVDVNKLDTATGTWFKLKGTNLGLDSRELRLVHERQGDWAYYFDYNEMPRFEPLTANTAVTGIGTANLAIPSTAAPVEMPFNLKMKREGLGFGYSKILSGGFDVQVRVRNEEKDGARIFSRGYVTAPGAWEFAPEPINSTTRQLDAILGYNTEKLYLAGAYYGSWYNNANSALFLTGGNATLATLSPIGLPPDSQAHQLSLSGNYAFTPTTRATFKAAYNRATQEDTFVAGVPLAAGIAADGNFGGRVDTTQLQAGISSRPTSKLSLLADARYEDRDDKSPRRQYTTAGLTATSTHDGFNEPRSIKTMTGKMEASYRLPMQMRVTGGLDYVEKERNSPSTVRVVSYRSKTEETSYRLVLQRSMSESVTGSIGYIHSDRDGTPFELNTNNGGTAVAPTVIAPLHLADRKRDKLRLSLNWTPVEQLSIQYQTEAARDDYAHLTVNEYGLRDGTARHHSIDLTYAFSDEWQGTAWISKNDTIANRADRAGTTNWASTLINDANSFGFGLRGKPTGKLEIGADLSHSEINDITRQWRVSGTATVDAIPDYFNRQSTFKLFGIYALEKNSSIRLDYIYDRYSSNDWTWSSWVYSDGTTLSQRPRQNVNFVGVSYIYKFY